MDIVKLAIERPMAVVAAMLAVVAFGLVAMQTIPIQLTPDVRRPILYVTSSWPGASPLEVERELTNRLEAELIGVEGVELLSSRSDIGRTSVTLEFGVGQNMDRAFMLVSNRLSAVSDLPAEAQQPRIWTSTSDDRPIARYAITRLPGNTRDIETFGTFVEDVVVERLQRVPGVSQVSQAGGSREELQIIANPSTLARHGLTIASMLNALRGANVSMSAGAVEEGKRRYVVRTDFETSSIENIRQVVLRTAQDPATGSLSDIRVGDVAEVRFGTKVPDSRRRFNGEPMIRLNVIRGPGANVIEIMEGVGREAQALNEGLLRRNGLVLKKFYDETTYINSAIALVEQNIYVGGLFAALILMLFLRSPRATLVVALAIPVSVISAFVAMTLAGRSINVVSLAGMAFAVGMVVDAALVVLENIFRHRQMGASAAEAAEKGTRQVWTAVLCSALTTVIVFVPVLLLQLPAGQLFRDIAVALSVSVIMSLLVSVTLIPMLTRWLFASNKMRAPLRLPVIDDIAAGFQRGLLAFIRYVIARRIRAALVVTALSAAAVAVTYLFVPKLDYLPDGNTNFVLGRVQLPPGYNLEATYAVAETIERATSPHWVGEDGGQAKAKPEIQDFFFLAVRDFTLIGASAVDQARAGALVPVLQDAIAQSPGNRGTVSQSSIFGRSIGGARVINVDIAGSDLDEILATARRAEALIEQALPAAGGTQVRALPGLDLQAPEVRITPDPRRLAHAGLTPRELGQSVDAFNDGLRVAEINVGSRRMDLTLKGPEIFEQSTQRIANLPVVTAQGTVVPTNSLATVDVRVGPTQVRHLDRDRAVTMIIRPPADMPLAEAIERVRTGVVEPLVAEGMPDGTRLRLSGAADDLVKTWEAMRLNMMLALVVVYLIMAVLFQSLIFPMIIMLSVPFAAAGGVIGLILIDYYVGQPLDMMTILGFVILIGIVVNNAILLVDQSLQNLRTHGMAVEEAILEASRNRLRPIFMSTLTSIVGLIPLVAFPGAGSELYRGLGSVVVGGLVLSALLTLVIIPSLLSMTLGLARPRVRAHGA